MSNNQHQQSVRAAGPRHGHMPMGVLEKPRNFGHTMKRLLGYLGKYRIPMVFVILISIGATASMIFGPVVFGQAITELFAGIQAQAAGTGGIHFELIAQILGTVLLIYGISTILSMVSGLIMSNIAADISFRFRKDISTKINRIPVSWFDKTPHGEVQSRITNDVDTINQTLSQSLSQAVSSVVTVLGVLIMMFAIDWRMTLLALVMIPLSIVAVAMIVKKSQVHFKNQQAALGEANAHVEEMYSGHAVLKAFNGEERSIAKFNKINEKLHVSAWKSQFLSGLMMPVMMIVANLGYVAVTIVGGILAAQRALTLGEVQAFIQYVRNFSQPLSSIANISNVLQQTAAAAERVFDFLEAPEETEAADRKPIPLSDIRGKVEFRNVAFGYDETKRVIKNFSAKVEPGQKIAIVGPTGAGKTTVVKLLMRFYDLNEGSIFLDGNDLRSYSREELRSQFAMVLQDSWLYNASVADNIRYGRPAATDAEVQAAAEAAHVDHFIRTWPGGYDMEINEETSNISQGQKQLLTIARAILADPRLLILDEATSSVDTRTEIFIQKAMDRLMEGRTSFIIAHRLSTIRNADLILVMNEGDIIEQGRHDELMAAGGFYKDLYNSQFEVTSQGAGDLAEPA